MWEKQNKIQKEKTEADATNNGKETCDITDRKSILTEPPIGEDFN